jgi:hypothetical protein
MRTIFVCVAVAIACAGCSGGPPFAPSSSRPLATVCTFQGVNLFKITPDDTGYDPSTLTGPTQTTSVDPTSQEYVDLQTAFNAAPDFFKTQLCRLKGVFIIPRNALYPNSWGFRNPNSPDDGGYIGLSQLDLWTDASGNAHPAIVLTDYENNVARSLLLGLNDPLPSFGTNTDTNTGTMTLLAVLSHEYGHFLWNKILVSPPGADPDYSKFCPGIFPTASWINTFTTPIKQVRYRRFGDFADAPVAIMDPDDPFGSADDPSAQEIKISTLKALLQQPTAKKLKKARKIIVHLLKSTKRSWPSLFGTFSANEDFVETFSLFVMSQATPPLSSLIFNTSYADGTSFAIDIPGTIINRGPLANKLLCFASFFLKNGP